MNRNILVIDDEPRLAESLAELLRQEGMTAEAATGGAAGMEKLKTGEYGLVITDLRMPGIDGFHVMNYVQEHAADTAIIVITGHASTQSAIEAIHRRVSDYITKPFELDTLVKSIEKVFAQMESEELRRDMIRMVSHDIKVPLNCILGFAQFLVDKRTGQMSDEAPEFAERIIHNTQKVIGLLDDYLTQARAEAGRLEVVPQPFRMEDITNEAIEMLGAEFERKHIRFEAEVASMDRFVYGDQNLLYRAVVNLLNNALKYTPDGGFVRVVLSGGAEEATEPCACLVVENSGPGIPADKIPRIFDRYTRMSNAGGVEGAGLGLYIVQQVLRAHGGAVDCDSKPGVITRFRLLIPFGEREAAAVNAGGR